MIEYLNGRFAELNPAHVVIDVNGIGYFLHISLNTFTSIQEKGDGKLFVHEVIREDNHLLYGFCNKEERELFRLLVSVSGVGASTGILFLSSLTVSEIRNAILAGDVDRLKSIKGIGLKTAQRILVELKDKIGKDAVSNDIFMTLNNSTREEALSALVTLGFVRKNAEKNIDSILKGNPGITVEQLIKDALKQM